MDSTLLSNLNTISLKHRENSKLVFGSCTRDDELVEMEARNLIVDGCVLDVSNESTPSVDVCILDSDSLQQSECPVENASDVSCNKWGCTCSLYCFFKYYS